MPFSNADIKNGFLWALTGAIGLGCIWASSISNQTQAASQLNSEQDVHIHTLIKNDAAMVLEVSINSGRIGAIEATQAGFGVSIATIIKNQDRILDKLEEQNR